jgi:hypothetical protein
LAGEEIRTEEKRMEFAAFEVFAVVVATEA